MKVQDCPMVGWFSPGHRLAERRTQSEFGKHILAASVALFEKQVLGDGTKHPMLSEKFPMTESWRVFSAWWRWSVAELG